MKQIQAARKYDENATMATVCCNGRRTCVTINIVGVLGAVGALALNARRSTRRFFAKPS
jgi:hypothetical protein